MCVCVCVCVCGVCGGGGGGGGRGVRLFLLKDCVPWRLRATHVCIIMRAGWITSCIGVSGLRKHA